VHYVAQNFDAIYRKDNSKTGDAYDLVVNHPADDCKNGRLIVSIERDTDGDYYDVRSTMRTRADQFKNKEALWERAGASTSSAEADPLSPEGQNDKDSVARSKPENNTQEALPKVEDPDLLHQSKPEDTRGGFDPITRNILLGDKSDFTTFALFG